MTFYGFLFYLLAFIVVASTAMAITRRHLVHTVVYLVLSFTGTALLFYLLGAPLLAVLEVIVYAGAIMVLFLFVVMMIRTESSPGSSERAPRRRFPALFVGAVSLLFAGLLLFGSGDSRTPLRGASASPIAFGVYLFEEYWFPVEIASFLLLIGLVGALYLGRQEDRREENPAGEAS